MVLCYECVQGDEHTLMDDDEKVFIMNRASAQRGLHRLRITNFVQLQIFGVGNSSRVRESIDTFLFGSAIVGVDASVNLGLDRRVEGLGEVARSHCLAQTRLVRCRPRSNCRPKRAL